MLYSYINWENGKTLKSNIKLDKETAYSLNQLLSLNLQPCRYVAQSNIIHNSIEKHIESNNIKELITKNNIYNTNNTNQIL